MRKAQRASPAERRVSQKDVVLNKPDSPSPEQLAIGREAAEDLGLTPKKRGRPKGQRQPALDWKAKDSVVEGHQDYEAKTISAPTASRQRKTFRA